MIWRDVWRYASARRRKLSVEAKSSLLTLTAIIPKDDAWLFILFLFLFFYLKWFSFYWVAGESWTSGNVVVVKRIHPVTGDDVMTWWPSCRSRTVSPIFQPVIQIDEPTVLTLLSIWFFEQIFARVQSTSLSLCGLFWVFSREMAVGLEKLESRSCSRFILFLIEMKSIKKALSFVAVV